MTAVLGEYVRARSKPAVRLLPCLCLKEQSMTGRDFYGPMVTFSRILSTVTLAIPAFVVSSSIVLYGRLLTSLSESSLPSPRVETRSAWVALLMSTRVASSLPSRLEGGSDVAGRDGAAACGPGEGASGGFVASAGGGAGFGCG